MISHTVSGGEERKNSLASRSVKALRRSFFLSFAVFGVLLIAMGYGFELLWMLGHPLEDGVIAGMLGIFGMTALLIGAVGYGTLRHMREY